MLRASMKVLIKRIQKRGASSFCVEMWERVILGVNLIPSDPVPCGASTLFPRFTTEPSSCTCVPQHREKPLGQCEEEDWEALISLFFFFFLLFPPFHLPWLHPCQPKPSRLSLTGEVINFIYTLIRCSDKTLSLWVAGVKGLWGSACQSVLKFSRLIATHRQRRDGAIPSRP